MPLVGGLTKELKDWLTPDKLRWVNRRPENASEAHPDAVLNDFIDVLTRAEMHYEAILGYLETKFRHSPVEEPNAQHYYGLYVWLVELVYWLLYFRHVKNVDGIVQRLRYFEGIVGLAAQNSPLWIFSLNHDLMMECLAAHYSIPLNSGFTSKAVLPRRDQTGTMIGELQVEVISEKEFVESGLSFFPWGTYGINLLKIHGALDVFTFRDGKDLLKLLPVTPDVPGVIESLRIANEELLHIQPGWSRPMKATNEIAYMDGQGIMQFLRRSLLAGAHKFNERYNQVLPRRFLELFKLHLNNVSRLVSIGYGFGDSHINTAMQEWLEFSPRRRLVIVGPGVKSIPPSFLHLTPQVDLIDMPASDYLEQYSTRPLNNSERALKNVQGRLLSMTFPSDPAERQEIFATIMAQEAIRLFVPNPSKRSNFL